MTVPTRFMRDWVVAHYADRLRALWGGENPAVQGIDIVVQPERRLRLRRGTRAAPTTDMSDLLADRRRWSAAARPRSQRRSIHRSRRDQRAARSALHLRALRRRQAERVRLRGRARVAEAKRVPFNPLFLYGGVGLGKTHLMHAIAWHIRQREPQRTVIYLSAEKFMYRFIRALREQNTVDFKEQFRSVDVLMIDDVQFISGKEFDPGGVLPHLQHAGRPGAADRAVRRQVAVRSGGHAGAAEVAAELRPGRRHPRHHLRAAAGHPAIEGRPARHRRAAEGDGVPRPPHHLQRPRAGRRAQPRRRPRAADRPRDHPRDDPGGAARPAARQRPADHHRRHPEAGGGALQHPRRRHVLGAPRPRRSPGRGRWRCTSPSS